MKRKTAIILGLVAATAIGGAVLADAVHDQYGPRHMFGEHMGEGMMQGHEGQGYGDGMMQGHEGQGHGRGDGDSMGGMMHMRMQAHGQMPGGMDMMGGPGSMISGFDADEDGQVSPDELRAGLQAALTEYDANGDGTLSLDEFEAFHMAAVREMTVDRFQMLDSDGDGQVTTEEFTAPADRMASMQRMAGGFGFGHGQGHEGRMGDTPPMMDDDN